MNSRLLGVLLLMVSCGKQVNIDHTALEEASKLSTQPKKSGVISKPSEDSTCIQFDGFCYQVGDNSSHLATTFIKNSPSETKVSFEGVIRNDCFVKDKKLNGRCLIISEIQKR